MRLAAFDLEIVKAMPEGETDWWAHAPFGVSCVAVALSDSPNAIVWSGSDELGVSGTRAAVNGLLGLVHDGYTLVGFNSLGFDFRVLASESGMVSLCAMMARLHIDIYFHLFCQLGYGPGLDRLAKGLGLPGKTEGVNGAKAPQMWANGQRQQVIDYCVQDVRTTLAVAQIVMNQKSARWLSKNDKPVYVNLPQWLSVGQAYSLPEPDTSWMTNPRKRSDFVNWMY